MPYPPSLTFAYRWRKLGWALCAIPFIWWGADTTPPFEVTEYQAPAPIYAGETLVFAFPVKRDVMRGCSVKFSRHIFDANGQKYELTGDTTMSAQALYEMHQVMGNFLKLSIRTPEKLAPGTAQVISDLHYYCNPVHYVFPIHLRLAFPFEVLPRTPASYLPELAPSGLLQTMLSYPAERAFP